MIFIFLKRKSCTLELNLRNPCDISLTRKTVKGVQVKLRVCVYLSLCVCEYVFVCAHTYMYASHRCMCLCVCMSLCACCMCQCMCRMPQKQLLGPLCSHIIYNNNICLFICYIQVPLSFCQFLSLVTSIFICYLFSLSPVFYFNFRIYLDSAK